MPLANMNAYQRPMQPWPTLTPYSRRVTLPKSGLTLHLYDTGGDHPPLLLVHGLGDDADTWRTIIPPLTDTYRLIAPDLPGFGRSDKPRRDYTLPFLRDVIIELMDGLALPTVVLVGHSLGAIIAQAVALEAPGRLERLVVIGGGLLAQPSRLNLMTLLLLVPGVGEYLYNRLRRDPQAAYQSLAPYYYQLAQLPQPERDFLFQRVNERVWDDGQRYAFFSIFRNLARWLLGQQRDLPARLANLSVPTLAIWGEADQINAVDNGRILIQVQPAARLIVVPNAGHNVQQEQPAVIVDALQSKS